MARSQPSIFANCDKCEHEVEVLVEDDRGSFESQVDEELRARGWLVTDEEDICDECKEN